MTVQELRREFTKESFRAEIERSLGHACCNCGSTEGIEYHHIVPIAFGGTNRLSNIVPLCSKCHKAAHNGRHITEYAATNHTGRPKSFTDELAEKILPLYACGEITRAECQKLLGLSKGTKLHDSRGYMAFLRRHGIKSIRNTRDVATWKGTPAPGKVICTVEGADSNPFELCVTYSDTDGAKGFLATECGLAY